MACFFPFHLDPAAARGLFPHLRMFLQRLALGQDLVAVDLLGVSSAVCTCQPPSTSTLASLRLPGWSSVRLWLLFQQSGSVIGPVELPAPAHILRVSAPVRRGAVDDDRLAVAYT